MVFEQRRKIRIKQAFEALGSVIPERAEEHRRCRFHMAGGADVEQERGKQEHLTM